jgi:hypothetical protein
MAHKRVSCHETILRFLVMKLRVGVFPVAEAMRDGSKGSAGGFGSVFPAIGGFWRPGNVDNAGLRRSVAPNVDGHSVGKRKD